MTSTLPSLHSHFLQSLLEQIRLDARFEAVLGGGSMIHGGFDEHSDLDLVLVVARADYSQVLADRFSIAKQAGPLLSAFTGEHVGEPRLLICLYGPELLHVDLKFVTFDGLEHLIERPRILWARDEGRIAARLDAAAIEWPNHPPEWFEQRAWVWLHYGAVKLQRGELFEAMGMVAFFRDQILGPLLHRRAGRPQRGVRRIETDPAASEILRATVCVHDKASVATALKASADLYLQLREDMPPQAATTDMPAQLLPLLEAADVDLARHRCGHPG